MSEPLKARSLSVCARSERGLVRKRNEDAAIVGRAVLRDEAMRTDITIETLTSAFVAGVADGMGGHQGGDMASRHVATRLAGAGVAWSADWDASALARALEEVISATHDELLAMSEADESIRGLGSTCTVIACTRNAAVLAHVGDSRCYRLRDGILSLQSRDHTAVAGTSDGGVRTVLTNSVGAGDVVVVETTDLTKRLLPGDVYLICSDGAADARVPDDEVAACLMEDPGVARIVDAALARGGADNITAVRLTVQ